MRAVIIATYLMIATQPTLYLKQAQKLMSLKAMKMKMITLTTSIHLPTRGPYFGSPVLRLMTLQSSQTMSVKKLLLLQTCTTALIKRNFRLVCMIQITTNSFAALCLNVVDTFHHLFPSILKLCQQFHQLRMCHFRAMKIKVCSYMDIACVIH